MSESMRRGDKSVCDGCRWGTRVVDRETTFPDGDEFKGPRVVDTVFYYCQHPVVSAGHDNKRVSFIAERIECGFREQRP